MKGAGFAPENRFVCTVTRIEEHVELLWDEDRKDSDRELWALQNPSFSGGLTIADGGRNCVAQQFGYFGKLGFRPNVIARELALIDMDEHFEASQG